MNQTLEHLILFSLLLVEIYSAIQRSNSLLLLWGFFFVS